MNEAPIYEVLTPHRVSHRSRRVRLSLSIVGVVVIVGIAAVIGSGITQHPDIRSATVDPSSNRSNLSAQLRQALGSTPVATPPPGAARPAATTASVAFAPAQTTAAMPSPAALLTTERVQTAETLLRTGHFVVTTKYDNGTQTMMDMGFTLGDGQKPQRLHVLTTYTGALNTHTLELIVIGQEAWQRTQGGSWVPKPGNVDVVAQVVPFLPHLANTNAVMDRSALRWYDNQTNTDIVLDVDAGTGVPRQMQQVARMGTPTFTVNYGGWNTPVSIDAPEMK